MGEKIKFSKGSWLENAGIVGIIRILGIDTDDDNGKNELVIDSSDLTNFSEKYFKYFVTKYGRCTKYHDIISFRGQIDDWISGNLEKFDEKDKKKLENLLNKIKQFVDSKSYEKVKELINSKFDVENALKKCRNYYREYNKLCKVEDNDNKKSTSILEMMLKEIGNIIDYFDRDDSHKYFPAKILCYKIISMGWNNVAFLNKNSKEKDFIKEYNDYFINPVVEYFNSNHDKDKYLCSTCGRRIKKGKRCSYSYSFINGMGYDVEKKKSNSWNYVNDLLICPICNFMYSAIPAGFNYNYFDGKGIFINYTRNLNELVKRNDAILTKMISDSGEANRNAKSPYAAFVNSFNFKSIESSKYNLANIQVINFDNSKGCKYIFTTVPKLASAVLYDCINKSFGTDDNLISVLENAWIKDYRGIDRYKILDDVVKRIINSANMDSLIYTIELLKATDSNDLNYNDFCISAILNINYLYYKELNKEGGLGCMTIDEKDLKKFRREGIIIRDAYRSKYNENKAKGLAYRLLQNLKANNQQEFLNNILNSCLYLDRIIPSEFISKQGQDIEFNQLGYAFVAGLISDSKDNVEK